MKTAIIISPDYLTAVYKQSHKFSFAIQGYGSFEKAISGILKVNCGELLGCAYISEKLPIQGSVEYKAMNSFLNAVNQLNDSKKMIFILQNSAQQVLTGIASRLTNVRIYVTGEVPVITDSVIDQNLFGSLILDNTDAYKLNAKENQSSSKTDDFLLHFVPVVSKNILSCCDPIDKLETFQLTIENDMIYQDLNQQGNQIFASVRKELIQKAFGITDKRLKIAIDKMMEDLPEDIWCVCNVIRGGMIA